MKSCSQTLWSVGGDLVTDVHFYSMSGAGQTMDEIKDDPIFTTPKQTTRRRSPYAARDLSDSVDGGRRSWWVFPKPFPRPPPPPPPLCLVN
jgi:hypothetical protein